MKRTNKQEAITARRWSCSSRELGCYQEKRKGEMQRAARFIKNLGVFEQNLAAAEDEKEEENAQQEEATATGPAANT